MVCLCLHTFKNVLYLCFLNFFSGNVESTRDENVLESSPDSNGFISEKDQSHDISEIPDGDRHSECLNEVISLTTLYLYVDH